MALSTVFSLLASFVCPDGGPNDEGMARSAYFDTIAENQMLYEKKIEELTAQDCMSILQKYMSKVIMEHIKNDIANKIIILPNDINEISHIEGSVEQLIQRVNIYPSESGFDAIIIGLMVYIADMKISRRKLIC